MKKILLMLALLTAGLVLAVYFFTQAQTMDLLQRYPTTLAGAMLQPDQARPWEFKPTDVVQLSRFGLQVGEQLKLETGPAKLGIGHGPDGAVWALVIPVTGGKVTRAGNGAPAEMAQVWLRFHPAKINQLFPPRTVSLAADTSIAGQMRTIADAKFRSSYHAGMNALIPEPKDMIVDVGTKDGQSQFFIVDTLAQTAMTTPKVIASNPADGATGVNPALTEITVTFDQDMGQGMSWTGARGEVPPSPPGTGAQWRDNRTCVLPVRLQPGRRYRVGINSPSYRNFRNAAGQPAEPSSLSFTTR